MGLGGTAKKIQTIADKAEQMYAKLTELREEVEQTQQTVDGTAERVQRLENEIAEQRAVLDAVAREVGVDLEAVSTEAHIADAEAAGVSGEENDDSGSVAADDTDSGSR